MNKEVTDIAYKEVLTFINSESLVPQFLKSLSLSLCLLVIKVCLSEIKIVIEVFISIQLIVSTRYELATNT